MRALRSVYTPSACRPDVRSLRQSDHHNLSLPGKAEVSVDVMAPRHFLADLKSTLSSERGGDEAGGRGGARRLKEFLTSLEQVRLVAAFAMLGST